MSATESIGICKRCLGAIVLLAWMTPQLAPSALAQAPASASVNVTDADIARAQRAQPLITEQDMERARKKYPMPSEAELRHVPLTSTPNIDALPQPNAPRPPDLAAIARGFEANAERINQAQGMVSSPGLLIFVSFSMPEPTLMRLADQAARAKATLMLRGFVNGSLRDTVLRVQRLIGKRHVAFQIDPQAFDRFAISKTPSFVLVRDGARTNHCATGQCYPSDAFVVTAGDVSLDYALEAIQRAIPGFSQSAAGFLQKLRSGR